MKQFKKRGESPRKRWKLTIACVLNMNICVVVNRLRSKYTMQALHLKGVYTVKMF